MVARSSKELLREIRAVVEAEQDMEFAAFDDVARCEHELHKWQLIHKYIHDRPFRTRMTIARSEQWREALTEVREVGDPELIDWMLLQVAVAGNLERGIQDLRPRKNGPCHELILEYVGNRKRKALAVLHFAQKAETEGCYRVDGAFHSRTAEILNRHRLLDTDEEGKPVPTTEPMARS
ncbi:MAG TPA: hypothetical protein PLJ34_06895 [Hyphomicrobiales bacterium]|nr:hypothetical protein [Hyphomicrobiales bacterium]